MRVSELNRDAVELVILQEHAVARKSHTFILNRIWC